MEQTSGFLRTRWMEDLVGKRSATSEIFCAQPQGPVRVLLGRCRAGIKDTPKTLNQDDDSNNESGVYKVKSVRR